MVKKIPLEPSPDNYPDAYPLCVLITGHKEGDSGPVAEVYNLTFPSKESYCSRHGYAFLSKTQSPRWNHWVEKGIHFGFARLEFLQSWIKIELSQPEHLRAKYVLWMDADSAITNPNIVLHDLLDLFGGNWAHYFFTMDRCGLHTGTMAFRVSQESLDFLSAALNCDPKFHNGNWVE